jgi:hypothetical protein
VCDFVLDFVKEQKKREEEKSTLDWLANEQEEETDEEELLEPPSYVTELGYRPSPMQVLNDYEPNEQGICVICGSSGPVEAECDNFPEAVSIYSPVIRI